MPGSFMLYNQNQISMGRFCFNFIETTLQHILDFPLMCGSWIFRGCVKNTPDENLITLTKAG